MSKKSKKKQSIMAGMEDQGEWDREKTAAYIADLLQELEILAAQEAITPLVSLLALARKEARRIAKDG